MPHAEIKHSDDLKIDHLGLLGEIEAVINAHDAGAGVCKGRAYPCQHYHHTHCLIEVSLLRKPHRDEAFMKSLLGDLERTAKGYLKQDCHFSLALSFSPNTYVTNKHAAD